MKKVLIVDDEEPFLLSLLDGLRDLSNQFEVFTAVNGVRALEVLAAHRVDLVVTDLKMPEMSGFDLLAHMSRHYPAIPVIVMTAHGTRDTQRSVGNLGATHYLEKPIDLGTLVCAILDSLEQERPSFVRGFSLAAFLQLIELDRKSCTLRVKADGLSGSLHFSAGRLTAANNGIVIGNAAALEILAWDETGIEVLELGENSSNVTAPLQHLLLEAYRLKDEKSRPAEIRKTSSLIPAAPVQTHAAQTQDTAVDSLAAPVAQKEQPTSFAGSPAQPRPKEGRQDIMALETHLADLKEVKGYKASGILNFTGEILVGDSIDPNIDVAYLGATFNDIFRTAHTACEKIGLEPCREATFVAPLGIVVIRCSGAKSRVHFHVLSVVAADGNQALAKMKMERMVQPVMDELG